MAQNLTLEEIEDLQAKGVYTPDQAAAAKLLNNAYDSAPSKKENTPGIMNSVANALYEPGADKPNNNFNTAPSPIGPTAVNSTVQPTPQAAPTPQVQQSTPDAIPASIAAPGVTNTVPPATFNSPNTPTQNAGATPLQQAPTVNIASGAEGRDARANEITSKYDGMKAPLQEQLSQAQASGDTNRAAALQIKIKGIDDAKDKELNKNETAFKMWDKSTGDLDPSKLGTITPRQNADIGLTNALHEQGKVDSAVNLQRAGIEAQTRAQVAEGDARAAAYGDMASQMKQSVIDRDKSEALFQTELTNKNNQIDASIKDFNNSRIDPNAYWEKQSTGGLIGTTILAGLVGGLNAANGISGNPVLSRIDQLINNDIDAQKANLEKKAKGIEFQNSALANFERQGYDREQAIALTQAASYDAVKTQLQSELAKTGNDQAKASGMQLMGQLNQLSQEKRQSVLAPIVQRDLNAHTATPTGTGASGRSLPYKDKDGNYMVVDYKTNKTVPANQQDMQAGATYKKTSTVKTGPDKTNAKVDTQATKLDTAFQAVQAAQNASLNLGSTLTPDASSKVAIANEKLKEAGYPPLNTNIVGQPTGTEAVLEQLKNEHKTFRDNTEYTASGAGRDQSESTDGEK